MAINWQFNADNYEERSFEVLPIGDYRIRVEKAEQGKSAKGNDLVKLTFAVSGKNTRLFHYITFLPNNPEATDQMLGDFWDSFQIAHGNLEPSTWIGKVGACRTKHEEYEGEKQHKVAYFKKPNQVEKLPPWVESSSVHTQPVPPPTDADVPFDMDDIPL
ncbi:MAG: DUF669 domain-containing protein [Firmicutes bacterium]|nr:DUF669 domain-containing protein [Bacillota bacterium]